MPSTASVRRPSGRSKMATIRIRHEVWDQLVSVAEEHDMSRASAAQCAIEFWLAHGAPVDERDAAAAPSLVDRVAALEALHADALKEFTPPSSASADVPRSDDVAT